MTMKLKDEENRSQIFIKEFEELKRLDERKRTDDKKLMNDVDSLSEKLKEKEIELYG